MDRQPGEQLRGAGSRVAFGLDWSPCALCVVLAAGSPVFGSLLEKGLVTLAVLSALNHELVSVVGKAVRPEHAGAWLRPLGGGAGPGGGRA